MNNQYLAEVINKLLVGLSNCEIQQVLTQVSLDQQCSIYEQSNSNFAFSTNIYRRKRATKISKDPEVEAFIHSLPYMEQTEMLEQIRAKYGSDRAPSRTGLSRYFMALRKTV
tara:strand:- start:11397 stop:11732 length:336 start_codon:yes stop_codon:yes gene_type:complete